MHYLSVTWESLFCATVAKADNATKVVVTYERPTAVTLTAVDTTLNII